MEKNSKYRVKMNSEWLDPINVVVEAMTPSDAIWKVLEADYEPPGPFSSEKEAIQYYEDRHIIVTVQKEKA